MAGLTPLRALGLGAAHEATWKRRILMASCSNLQAPGVKVGDEGAVQGGCW